MTPGPVIPINISAHAAQRYIERVADVSVEQARAALSCRAVVTACAFGAPFVRLASGHRVVISGMDVVTVLPIVAAGTLGRGS
jgi:phosphate uptake regulator